MNAATRALTIALLCTAAVACTKKVKEVPPVVDATPPPVTQPVPTDDGVYSPEDLDTDACLRTRVVYFDFDQATIRPEFQAAMACHSKYLRDRPSARMNLEGNAVWSALQANGASSGQGSVISYGEERPVCTESTEDCWARNRRVEIVYTVK